MMMGRYLRQIVDNSFEEGQFESAVAQLDQLRSADHSPSPIHVLHLVFIALHPAHDVEQLNNAEQSPRKITNSLVLSASAVVAAQQLLMAFIATNPPDVFGAALPAYPETKNEPLMEFEFSESMIFHQAAAIKHSKNCWEILKSSFTARTTSTPKGKGRQRIRFVEPSFSEQHIKVVADDSWFVLEWLVALFEKDAEATAKQGQQKHSPLLLKQIPPPPIGSSARWDASEPLRVVFYAFQQSDLRRQRSGIRLLNLLIDLTQTPHLNLPSFASTALAQLTTTTSPEFITLFSLLPSTPAALSFKLALCKKIIQDASDARGSRNSTTGAVAVPTAALPSDTKKPRAQPRAIPRQRGATITAERSLDSIDAPPTPSAPLSSTYVARLPTYTEVVQLLRTPLPTQSTHLPNKPWATPALLLRVKFELLLAFGVVQAQRGEAVACVGPPTPTVIDAPDPAFMHALADGSFRVLLEDEVFAPRGDNEDEDSVFYVDVLRGVVGLGVRDEDMA